MDPETLHNCLSALGGITGPTLGLKSQLSCMRVEILPREKRTRSSFVMCWTSAAEHTTCFYNLEHSRAHHSLLQPKGNMVAVCTPAVRTSPRQ